MDLNSIFKLIKWLSKLTYEGSNIDMGFLRWIIGVLIILWLLGFVLNIGGSMIHALIVIAVILFIFDIIGGRRRS